MALRSHHSYRLIRKSLNITIGALVLVMAGTASANRVTLVATVNNQAVLLPASWVIFKLHDTEHAEPIVTLPRHSGTVHLAAGHYRATVTQENTTKQTEFRVESNVDKTVTVALD